MIRRSGGLRPRLACPPVLLHVRDVRDYAATLNDSLNPHPEEGARAPVSKDEAEDGLSAVARVRAKVEKGEGK